MKNLLVSIVVAGTLLLTMPLAAFAAVTMGTIASVDANLDTITLDDGKTYAVPSSAAATVMVGDSVTVTFTTDAAGKLTASDVSEYGSYR
jgi:hypothetical protein